MAILSLHDGAIRGECDVRAFPVARLLRSVTACTAAAGHRGSQEACSCFHQVSGMLHQTFFPREEREADESILSEDGHVLNYGTYKNTTSLYN